MRPIIQPLTGPFIKQKSRINSSNKLNFHLITNYYVEPNLEYLKLTKFISERYLKSIDSYRSI